MKKNIRVVAAIIEKEDMILIARRLTGNQAGHWEFPGGKYEENETGPEALKREIREEFDADIEVSGFLCTVRHRYPEFNLIMDCFTCHLITGDLKLHDHSAVRWISPQQRGTDWVAADRKVIREYRKHLKEKTA